MSFNLNPSIAWRLLRWVVYVVVVVALLVSRIEVSYYKGKHWASATYAGKLQADKDAENGKKRIYKHENNGGSIRFSGKKIDGFELWFYPNHDLGVAGWFINDSEKDPFIEAYNRRMERLWNE